MEEEKALCLDDCEWDITTLIEEYANKRKQSKKDEKKAKKSAKKQFDKDDDSKQWQLGDYCRAVYEADGLFYEVIIENIEYGVCTVEFIGYGDKAEVPVDSLKKSKGKKARRKQMKKANVEEQNCSSHCSDSETSNAEKVDVSVGTAQGQRYTSNAPGYQSAQTSWRPHEYSYNEQSCQPYAPAAAVSATHNIAHGNENGPIPVPPLPCFVDSAMASMLSSWFMAGYYTGLNQGKKSSHGHHSCNRDVSNCCSHH